MKINTKINAFSLVILLVLFAASFVHGSELRRTTLRAEQMRCSSCLRVIDAELRKVPGIVGMTSTFREAHVIVDHGSEVPAEKIADVISGLGYPATVVSGRKITEREANRFRRAGFGGGAGYCNPGGSSPVAESWKELRRRIFRKRRQREQIAAVEP